MRRAAERPEEAFQNWSSGTRERREERSVERLGKTFQNWSSGARGNVLARSTGFAPTSDVVSGESASSMPPQDDNGK